MFVIDDVLGANQGVVSFIFIVSGVGGDLEYMYDLTGSSFIEEV